MKSKLIKTLLFITLTINSVLLSAEVMIATIKGKVTDEKNQPIDIPVFEDGENAYFSNLPIYPNE